LAVAPDERALQPCDAARPCQRKRTHQLAAADTAGLALGGHYLRVVEFECALCSRCGALAHEDLTRLGGLLEAGGGIDGLPGLERAAFAGTPDHDLAQIGRAHV